MMILQRRRRRRRRRRNNNNNNNSNNNLLLQQVLFVATFILLVSSSDVVSATANDNDNHNDNNNNETEVVTTTATGEDNNNNNNINNNIINNNNNNTCPPCPTNQCSSSDATTTATATTTDDDDSSNNNNNINNETITCQILVLDSPGIITMVDWNAKDYYKHTNGRVKIEIKLAATMDSLYEEIENDARYGGTLFDAYYTNPIVLGTAATLGGLLDLTEYVKNSPIADWTDVLLALRTYVTSFEDKIYIILLDGDTHTMFYRRDVLDYFNLQVPRTWDEYTEVAKFVHGKEFISSSGDNNNNQTTILNGSCISRIKGDHAMFWSHLILSTITQTSGTSSGSLFDTSDMTPLTGVAMAEMLRIHENHMKYGTSDELSDIINHVQNGHMNDGTCVMTFMWGDMFRRSNSQGSILHSRLGIAPTPGSTVVLNRRTKKLEKCTKITCPYAKYYPDIGFVNSAPYAANGGWGAAISANTDPIKQKALAEFFIWASSKKQSQQYVIPNSTLPWYEINGQDPWRKSQLDVDKWVKQGYDRELSKQYVESILTNLISKNVVVEIRFPKAGEIMSVLDKEVNEHLVKVASTTTTDDDTDDDDDIDDESQKHQQRLIVAQRISDQWNQIIKSYNNRGDTSVPILETYQRLRGVYIPNEEKNYLTKVRPVGLTMMTIIFAVTIFCIVWVCVKHTAPVVRSSQPPFLLLICFGVIVLASSIIPMGIDDSLTTNFDGASMACMATPWLVSLGFCICFAALFSKIYRLKTLMNHAASFRRIQVSVQDVLLPFVIIMILNLIFLLTWTIVDPLYWERVDLGRNGDGIKESYGRCTHSGTVSPIMAGLIGAVAIVALILANIQAYQTRELSVAFNESKFVALAMASILQALLIGLPLLFLSDANTTARYLVRCILVFVVCMSVIGFIFLPKILRGDKKDENIGRISAAKIGASHRASWQLELNKEAEVSSSIVPRHSAVFCGYSGAENNSTTSLGVRFSDVNLAVASRQQLPSNDFSLGGQAAVSKEFVSELTSSSPPPTYGAETSSSEERKAGMDSDFDSIPSSTVDYSDPPSRGNSLQEPSNEASKIQLEAKSLPDPTKIQEEPSTDELEQMETNHQPQLPS